jgi:hypothetical protein
MLNDQKINAYLSSESFGAITEKMILIYTKESDAFIYANKNGFKEEYADDLNYALEIIRK